MNSDDPRATTPKRWRHAPPHRFVPGAMYFVTASTYLKQLLFVGDERLKLLQETVFAEARRFDWALQAWAFFPNHYHFVALAPEDAGSLAAMVKAAHSRTAIALNKLDATPGRRVWWQYRDTCLDSDRSFYARLNYTHRNPEKHGVAKDAREYRWCSMAWFLEEAESQFRNAVLAFDATRVDIADDF